MFRHMLSLIPAKYHPYSVAPRCFLWQLEVRGLWHFLLLRIMKCDNNESRRDPVSSSRGINVGVLQGIEVVGVWGLHVLPVAVGCL